MEMVVRLTRRQHFIPRFLLKRFSGGKKKQVWVFDKTTGTKFRTNPANIAAERDLYNIELGRYVATVELSLAKLESTWAAILKNTLRVDSIDDLSAVDRIHLAVLITHLHLRSPNSQEMRAAMVDSMREKIRSLGGDPDALEETRRLSSKDEKRLSVHLLQNLPENIAPLLVMKRWALHSTGPRRSLYLSDNPVAMHNERRLPYTGNLGFGVPGIEVYLPVSSTRCLALYCPSLFGGTTEAPPDTHDSVMVEQLLRDETLLSERLREISPPLQGGRPWPLRSESVIFLNSLQVWNAERYLFSDREDFSLAEEMISQDERLRFGPRPVVN